MSGRLSDSGFSAAASSLWTSSSLTPDGTGLVWDFDGSFGFVSDLFSATSLGTADPGYIVLIGASAGTSMRGSTGSSDFSGTVSLDSITLPGGAPLPADVSFSFDSGLAAVPEPAAPALLGLALAALSRLRRRLV